MPLIRTELEDIFWRVTIKLLGMDPDSEDQAVQQRVRFQYPDGDMGNSDWKRNEDVIFLSISPTDEDYTLLREASFEEDSTGNLKEVVRYHKCHSLQWICYGPHCDEDADRIRIGILREPVRAYLRKNNLAVLSEIPQPIRISELDEAGQTWERTDLTARCYELAERSYPAAAIELPPEFHINATN